MAFCEPSNYSSGTQLVPPTSGNDVTQLLKRWRKGSRDAESALMERVQGELRRLAAGYLRHERGGRTLQPTAVVNEAYIRLLPQRGVSWENRAHFFGLAANMMRRILVDYAKTKYRAKRGGKDSDLPLEEAMVVALETTNEETKIDLILLDEALNKLALEDQQEARIVELRYFSGLTIEETAEVLGISTMTVKRDWNVAKAWLRREMTPKTKP
jgi:RNA polymerase sigma factor (TIGR02999 family)